MLGGCFRFLALYACTHYVLVVLTQIFAGDFRINYKNYNLRSSTDCGCLAKVNNNKLKPYSSQMLVVLAHQQGTIWCLSYDCNFNLY